MSKFIRRLLTSSVLSAVVVAPTVVIESWRREYNTYRPHSALGNLTPSEYRARWVSEHQTARTPDPSPALRTALWPS